MKTLKTLAAITTCLLVSLTVAGISIARDIRDERPLEEIRLVKKADLIVERITINKIDKIITPRGIAHKVKIKVTIKNAAVGPRAASTTASSRVGSGEFKFKIEWSDYPPRGFNYLTHAPGRPLKPGQSRTITFNDFVDTVPLKVARKYRVTVDYVDWIREWDEGNNVSSTGYYAR